MEHVVPTYQNEVAEMSSKTKQNVKAIEKVMDKQQENHIGSIAMWNLISPAIEAQKLQDLFSENKLDWDKWGPEQLDGSVTFHKAINETKRVAEGWRFVTILDGMEKKVIGIVKEEIEKTKEDVRYKTDWSGDAVKITYDKTSQSIKTTNSAHAIGSQVVKTFKSLADIYTTSDFTRFLVRNIKEKAGALQLRPTGGVYFLPASHYDLLLKLKAIIETCGSEFTILNIHEDSISKQGLGRSALNSLGEELKDLEVELEKWKEITPRADTISRRLESYKDLKNKATMYSSILKIKSSAILSKLKECKQKALGLLGVVESEREAKKQKSAKVIVKSEPKTKIITKQKTKTK